MSSPDDTETDAERTARSLQLTRADLTSMTPQAIEQARVDGRLTHLMSTAPTKENRS